MVWGVAALLQATGDALSARFGAVSVRGELSGFVRATSGHCYFALKDPQATGALIKCAMFRRASALLDFKPTDGLQVELLGRLGVYEPRGELQMVVEGMRRVGLGTLYEEFLRLRQALQAQGLFDQARKRSVSREPRTIGVITSIAGAALHDVLTALARRAPHVGVVIYPALVQGAQAPAALRTALALANERDEVDTLLLVRGGGSLEDLWAFNDEALVRAVVASRLQVICGVGHETDVTLCDLAADLRAPTPTAAAELASPAHAELSEALVSRSYALSQVLIRALQTQSQRLDRLSIRLEAPATAIELHDAKLNALLARTQSAASSWLNGQHRSLTRQNQDVTRAIKLQQKFFAQQLQAKELALQGFDPARVLHRGYALVQDAQGGLVRSASEIKTGSAIKISLAQGQAEVVPQSVQALPG